MVLKIESATSESKPYPSPISQAVLVKTAACFSPISQAVLVKTAACLSRAQLRVSYHPERIYLYGREDESMMRALLFRACLRGPYLLFDSLGLAKVQGDKSGEAAGGNRSQAERAATEPALMHL